MEVPHGLLLASSTGAITGTPQVANGTTSLTVRVQDSGTPQQSAQKLLSITIGLPSPPNITDDISSKWVIRQFI